MVNKRSIFLTLLFLAAVAAIVVVAITFFGPKHDVPFFIQGSQVLFPTVAGGELLKFAVILDNNKLQPNLIEVDAWTLNQYPDINSAFDFVWNGNGSTENPVWDIVWRAKPQWKLANVEGKTAADGVSTSYVSSSARSDKTAWAVTFHGIAFGVYRYLYIQSYLPGSSAAPLYLAFAENDPRRVVLRPDPYLWAASPVK